MDSKQAQSIPPEVKEINPYIKDCLVSLLENRPEDPMKFLSDYFQHAVYGSIPILRSYRYIRLCKSNRDAFMENLMSSFRSLDMKRVQENSSDISGSNQRSPPPGVTKSEYIQLLRMICADFPIDVLNGILTVLGVQNQEIVDFREFCGGVCACLQYEEFFEQVEWLYKTGASKDASTMDRKLLVKIIEEIKSNSNPNIQVPSDSVIKQTLKEADVGNGKIEFRDFVKAMFRLCIPEELVCATITR